MVEQSPAIRASAGVGVSWKSPVGPIRLDLAYPIRKEPFRQDPDFSGQFRHEVLMFLSYFRTTALSLPFVCAFLGSAVGASATCAPRASSPACAGCQLRQQNLTVMVVDVSGAACRIRKRRRWFAAKSSRSGANIRRRFRTRKKYSRAERDALQRQQASLSPEALNQKGRDFQQKVNELERNVQGKRQALEKSNGDALQRIQEQMLKIIADIAKQRKANLVFQRADLSVIRSRI